MSYVLWGTIYSECRGPGRPDIVIAGRLDIVNAGRADIVNAGSGESRYSERRVRGEQI
ncbi:unnamed protein product [Staurois parvus]|uniref:Uncharacterized protein n=1 Tax=Staurois parvus TaxID=386267 RepID=A0ABN9DVX4_9NEOB|nr:unnamed protein product [Staurois parvus]